MVRPPVDEACSAFLRGVVVPGDSWGIEGRGGLRPVREWILAGVGARTDSRTKRYRSHERAKPDVQGHGVTLGAGRLSFLLPGWVKA